MACPILFMAIGAVSLAIPIVRETTALRLGVYTALAIAVFAVLRCLVFRKPVLELRGGEVVIRGVRPGLWKLFQMPRTETIAYEEIMRVRAGYLRNRYFGLLSLPPPGEPSRNSIFQYFLWIEYSRNGRQCEIYHPHFKLVARYMDALADLRERLGAKFEQHEWKAD